MSVPVVSPRPRGTSHSAQRPVRSTPMTKPSTTLPRTNPAPLAPRMNGIAKTPSHVVQSSKTPGTPSPNYFGLAVNGDHFSSSAAQHIRGNWSPPTSNVRSTAAASPQMIPVEQNPEFEQFRKASENAKGFALGNFDFGSFSAAVPTKGPLTGSYKPPMSPQSLQETARPANERYDGSSDSSPKSPKPCSPKPRSPKRMLSTELSLFPDRPRRNSPASFEGFGRTDAIAEFDEIRPPRPSLPPARLSHHLSMRAETLPANMPDGSNSDGPTMATPQHILNILESAVEEVLLLDLRVSTQYAKSRIAGALSLCLPTTLLKRASFNVQKLAETFKDDEQRQKFEKWRNSKHIVVYDSNSAQLKDAATCINTLKKFTSEGWNGGTFIIRGGFQEFAHKFPNWITQAISNSPASVGSKGPMKLDLSGPAVAPVIGGCPMPATQNAANPFFGNIRQNMDLIGGVGQMPVKKPASMTESAKHEVPQWLQEAAEDKDAGKRVSDKFLHIEKKEQKRMQEALSGKVVYGTPGGQKDVAKNIAIAGIEKGSKNRYNNIWPYEHSRVKLEGCEDGSCDYINANHVQAAYSNKRYIATQGPIPATFKDFWNVVWQQDVRVIVMLTAEQEGGQVKAHNYWSDKHFGNLHLKQLGEHRASLEPSRIQSHKDRSQSHRPSLGQRKSTASQPKTSFFPEPNDNVSVAASSSEKPYVTVRKFTLSNDDEPFERMREITQLQYSNWPDFGAPAHPQHLLGLIEQTDAVVRSVNGVNSPDKPEPANSRPVVVHCSAGCGRTGTFCTVDSVLDMLKRQNQARKGRLGTPMDVDAASPGQRENGEWIRKEDVDLIEKTVEDFRLQRLSMVQSLRQFVLCYESVLEWVNEQHHQLKA